MNPVLFHPACPAAFLRASLTLAAILALSWCSCARVSAQEAGVFPPNDASAVTSPRGDGQPQRHTHIRKGDVVRVSIFQEPDLDTTSRVSENGTLTCPLIGAVKITGITVEEAATVIEAAYRDGYLAKPQAAVMVLQHSRQTVTILGQVSRPGIYELPADASSTSILQAVGMAGGFTRLASTSRVAVKRRTARGEEFHKVDVKSMASGKESRLFEVREGDVITVPEKLF